LLIKCWIKTPEMIIKILIGLRFGGKCCSANRSRCNATRTDQGEPVHSGEMPACGLCNGGNGGNRYQ
jgi:hypothetical protein